MQMNKLFRALVMGGAVLGAAAATQSLAKEPKAPEPEKAGKNNKSPPTPDAGQPEPKAGGVNGW